jgi:hypothetical protein
LITEHASLKCAASYSLGAAGLIGGCQACAPWAALRSTQLVSKPTELKLHWKPSLIVRVYVPSGRTWGTHDGHELARTQGELIVRFPRHLHEVLPATVNATA